MDVAVTGGTGFLGKNVIEVLKDEHVKVHVLNRKKENLLDPGTLKGFVSNKDVILHIAGVNKASNHELVLVNTAGTASLLEAISRYNPNVKLIFTSSFAVYTEGVYGLSKLYAEELIRYYTKRFHLKAIVLRIANVYGKGGKPNYNSVIATFLYNIHQGKPILVNGDGNQKRDYIYVSDVVSAILKAMYYKQSNNYEMFNVCSGKLLSLKTIVKKIQRFSTKKFMVNFNLKEQGTYFGKRIANKKTKQFLDWSPLVTIDDGLQRIIA